MVMVGSMVRVLGARAARGRLSVTPQVTHESDFQNQLCRVSLGVKACRCGCAVANAALQMGLSARILVYFRMFSD
jgi:hypothetical protein